MSPQLYVASFYGCGHFRRVWLRTAALSSWATMARSSAPPINPLDPESWPWHRSRTSQNLRDVVDSADGTFVASGNTGMILQSSSIRPRFTAVRPGLNGLILDIDPAIADNGLVLEATTDFHSWRAVATNSAANPLQVPVINQPAQFFRLVAP